MKLSFIVVVLSSIFNHNQIRMKKKSVFFFFAGFISLSIAQGIRLPSTHTWQSSRLQPIAPSDGWKAWSAWSTCSRSCGGGVRERRRNCRRRSSLENPSNISFCNGTSKLYQPCSSLPCPDGSIMTRESQCSKYNSREFSGSTYVWELFGSGRPCELSCKARGQPFFIRHSSTVTDGTDCSYTVNPMRTRRSQRGEIPKFICIDGLCKVVGCDGTVGSGLEIDKCGVCGGNGDTCHVVKGLFRQQLLSNDYHFVVRIPSGATRINITESSKTGSYIALRSANPDGSFYINGELNAGRPDPSQAYRVAGTVFRYNRPYQSMSEGETILAAGPTTEPLEVMYYHQGINPGIFFEYTVPNTPPPPLPSNRYRTDILDINGPNMLNHRLNGGPSSSQRLSQPVGAGHGYRLMPQQPPGSFYQNRFYHTPNRFGGSPGGQHYQAQPPSYRLPNSVPLHTNGRLKMPTNSGHYLQHWQRQSSQQVAPISDPAPPNSVPNPATNNLYPETDTNEEESSNIRREAIIVDRILPEPIGETVWRTRGFGPCTKSCAEGTKSTIVLCVRTDTNEAVDESFCTGPRPKMRTRRCNRQSCPAYYDVGEWSECTKTCGTGRRTRRVLCRQHFPGNFTTSVSHKRCRSLIRPKTHEKCKTQDCAKWEVENTWGECNVRCGTGVQSRRAVCKAGDGTVVNDASCSAARRPNNLRPCDAGPCVTRWYVTDWEECSADCDRGVQRRNVYCLNTMGTVTGCSSKFEPNSTRTCARSSCGTKYEWFAGKWGPCSSKCGNGHQIRKVTCLSVSPDGTMSLAPSTDSSVSCDAAEKPAIQQHCNTQSCGSRWHYTPWSACSVTCGGGSRSRDVQCLDEDGAFSSLCNFANRPKETERCNTVSCLALRKPNCRDRLSRCHMILQARLCSYTYYRRMCCETCSLSQSSDRQQRS